MGRQRTWQGGVSGLPRSIGRILSDYRKAILRKDVDALASLYHRDARIFDAWDTWSYQGRAAWRAAVHRWLESLGRERVRVGFQTVEASGTGGFAVVSAIVKYSALSPGGKVLRQLHNRLSWTLVAAADGWRIIHEHTSMPVAFDDKRALLRKN